MADFEQLAEKILFDIGPSPGIIGIDGTDGIGKSPLANLIGEQLNMDYIAQLEEKIEKLIKRKISFYLATKFLSTQPHIVLFNEKENR